jgi:hypothetical protein
MRRVLLAAVLICAFIALAANYEAHVTQHLDYPRESEVSANYDAYVGRNVTISGAVVSTGAQSFALKGAQSTYVILSSEAVRPGDQVTLVGTLEPGHQLRAVTMFVSPRLLSDLVYVRSFIALVFLAALFFLNWRFDWRLWAFRPREPGREREQSRQRGGE